MFALSGNILSESCAETAAVTTIRQALAEATQLLSAVGIETANLDAELLLQFVLQWDREQVYVNYKAPLYAEHQLSFEKVLARRRRHEPIAYITGRKEFWSLDFEITDDVLIPRPETERLVEVALEIAQSVKRNSPIRILDIGTGSGIIPVCLAREIANGQFWATDISPAALKVARANGQKHGVQERIQFFEGDLWQAVVDKPRFFDVIVSNPPYVRSGDIAHLEPDVRDWEPKTALDGGADGLDYYRRLIAEAHSYLARGGTMVVEIGADMTGAVARLCAEVGRYEQAKVHKDYAGWDRVLEIGEAVSGN
jgi:release factor glutamine methyltransferase